MLKRDEHQALEGIVGKENISEQPALLDSYSWQPSFNTATDNWSPHRPAAVVLPKTVEEVQEIVKLCNTHKIKYKAIATGWGMHGACHHKRQIQIDLCRMNRILDIDEKNRIAVVEPFAVGAQVQAEAMKLGLTLSISGASSITSPLASLTSTWGVTWHGLSNGHNARNMLAIDWVLPNGEILHLGSLESIGNWVHPDGPGPSLRGLVRGVIGSFGGNGVFTKGALKLYHYNGPVQ
ncbi:MAG: FAD-binding oxidoreductase, partial [Deltaproteobacteria bacterium]|nr:FAD-binding oxidoreductase [Deltaproteobacteria bacterium]